MPSADSSHASIALVTTFSTARWSPSGSKVIAGISGSSLIDERDPGFFGPGLHQLQHFAHDPIQITDHHLGLALLAEREHIHHQGRDPLLVFLDDIPSFATDLPVLAS